MSVHVLAILKGAAEGDPQKHFGSLLGYGQHLDAAVRLGLVDRRDTGVLATDAGREFYARHRLADLPDGRANHWGSATLSAAAALDKLTTEG